MLKFYHIGLLTFQCRIDLNINGTKKKKRPHSDKSAVHPDTSTTGLLFIDRVI